MIFPIRHGYFRTMLPMSDRTCTCAKVCPGKPYYISQLTKGSRLTRQAISKHLRILENVGVVHSDKCEIDLENTVPFP